MKKLLVMILCLTLTVSSACAEETVLNILGGSEGFWEVQFAQDHPEITLRHSNAEMSGQAYLTMLMTNDEYDVYELPVGPLYEALKEKGYLLPIETSEAVQCFSDRLYPYLQPVLLKDGQLYGVPIPSEEDMVECVSWSVWSYAKELWQEEGLGELPATYEELLTRMIDWEKNGGDSAYRLIDVNLDPGGFVATVFRAYVLQYETKNEVLSFDTPVFRQIMTLLKEYHDLYQPLDNRQALILPYGGYMSESGEEGYAWMAPPVFEEDQTASITASMNIYAVNARAKHPKEAFAYIEAALQALNEPSLLMMVQQEAREIKAGNWSAVTQVQAEQVQTLAKQVCINTRSEFLSGNHYYDMENMTQQYLQGSLPLDMLIKELDQRVQMVMKEK